MKPKNWHVALIKRLQSLKESDDRGALAALRRGMHRDASPVFDMYRYVSPFIPAGATAWEEEAAFLVAALYATHPKQTTYEVNLGGFFARMALDDFARVEDAPPSLHLRFSALLNSHADDLSYQLRQAIQLLESKGVAVNYEILLADVTAWDHPDRWVQRDWAKAFWTARRQKEGSDAKAGDGTAATA